MSIPFALAVFFIIWWVVLFVTLPFGARSSHEAGIEVMEGTEKSAPIKPRLFIKFLVTTVIALALFGLFYYIYTNDLLAIRPS